MEAVLQALPWDAEQLAIPCYAAHHTIPEQCLRATRGLTVIRIPDAEPGALSRLIRAGAEMIGTELCVEWRSPQALAALACPVPLACSVTLGPRWEPAFTEFITDFSGTRFFMDTRIPPHLARKMWETSFKNQCAGDGHAGGLCSVLYVDDEPAGIWNLKYQNRVYSTPFIGLLKKFRSKNLTAFFISETIRQAGISHIITEVFSSNYASCAMHQKAGFRVIGSRSILHYLDETTATFFKNSIGL